MDAELCRDPEYLPAFLEAFRDGADVAIGSRNNPGGDVEGREIGRHISSQGGSLYSRTIPGVRVRAPTPGHKALVRSNGYSFQIETTYRALRAGLRIKEVPIVFVERRVGKSRLSRKIFSEAIGMVWKLRLRASRGRS